MTILEVDEKMSEKKHHLHNFAALIKIDNMIVRKSEGLVGLINPTVFTSRLRRPGVLLYPCIHQLKHILHVRLKTNKKRNKHK